jgi:hypothetical protein
MRERERERIGWRRVKGLLWADTCTYSSHVSHCVCVCVCVLALVFALACVCVRVRERESELNPYTFECATATGYQLSHTGL